MNDRIEKRIELRAPISRVWKALTDYREFGEWSLMKVETPFAPGKTVRVKLAYPGYENISFEITVQKIKPEYLFSFTWHPYAIDTKRNYSYETPTLIEFRLEEVKNKTLLLLTESGFDKIPSDRRSEALRMNTKGWTGQMRNIESHVSKKP